jgi:UDP-N-acetylglucosamine--N-acetylmuramyl-(pentapeptide) pyrophosphoryl-undecaprenol N-acetylglucosamine transferase
MTAVHDPADAPTLLMAGGGSGGHIFPGLAIAERVVELDPSVRCLFACSQRPLDTRILEEAEAWHVAIPAQPLTWRPRGAARFLRGLRHGRRAAMSLIRTHRVREVLALGGFVAAPVVQAANALSVPVTLLNLDVPPGRANRWMARRCRRVLSAVAMPRDAGRWSAEVVGMPVRRRAICAEAPAACREALGLTPDRPTLLVVGGSQGAESLNRLAMALVDAHRDRFSAWQVIHLCGTGGESSIRDHYGRSGIDSMVVPFTDRMDLAWGAADLALSRAGASCVAEAALNCVPTLFLPYPFHRDQHQRFNAEPLVRLGGGSIATDHVDPGQNLREAGAVLLELMADERRRSEMVTVLKARSMPDAASTVARMLVGPRPARGTVPGPRGLPGSAPAAPSARDTGA